MSKQLNVDIVYLQPCLFETISLLETLIFTYKASEKNTYLYNLCTKVFPLPDLVATGGGAGEGG